MSPALLNIILLAVEEAVKLVPSLTLELQALFAKKDVTSDDWAALRARVVAKKYEDYDPGFVAPVSTAP